MQNQLATIQDANEAVKDIDISTAHSFCLTKINGFNFFFFLTSVQVA